MRKSNMFKIMGARTHAVDKDRQPEDFYATSPIAVVKLLEIEKFNFKIWEPATGQGHMAEVLKNAGHKVYCTDIMDRGYPVKMKDFLTEKRQFDGDIITNPPFQLAEEFIYHAHAVTAPGAKIALFLKLQFLETQGRAELFERYPMKNIYVSRKRIICAKDGHFEKIKSSAVAYAWYIWEKGYTGKTTLEWFN